jgi:uncharacterized repeat protein (TIGR03987 family)
MSPQVSIALLLITLALVCYSIGVWSEHFAGRLQAWHLACFWIGFVFDTLGTGIMFEVAGALKFNLHGVTGLLAIVLMLIHAIWATAVLIRKDEVAIANFHKFSVMVWCIWLIPYLSGLILSRR